MKFDQAMGGYALALRVDNISEKTIEVYLHYLKQFGNYLGNPEISEIGREQIREFLLYLQTDYTPNRPGNDTSPLSPSTIAIVIKAIKSFFTWAENDLELKRPDKNIKIPRVEYPQREPFTLEELRAILHHCKYGKRHDVHKGQIIDVKRPSAVRDTALVLLLLDTGMRIGEACRLNMVDIDAEDGSIFVRPHSTRKKSKGRTVFLGDRTKKAVWQHVVERVPYHDDHPLFITRNGRRFDPKTARSLINKIGKRAGVADATPHRFRHTFAIMYLRNGGDVFTLRRLLGHSSLRTVQRYLLLATEDMKAAHKRNSPGDRI